MTGGSMTVRDTLELVRAAKDGDRSAWSEIASRYYNDWLRKFHGRLDYSVRKLYDTQDLIQSAIGDAMRDISSLENETVFYVWVNAIIRHKIGMRRRRLCRERALSDAPAPASSGETQVLEVASLDEYMRCLEVMLGLFPENSQSMAAVSMKLLEGLSTKEISIRLGRPERTVYRWVETGLRLIKEKMRD